MTELTLNPGTDAGHAGDKLLAVPTLTAAAQATTGVRRGLALRHARRRFTATQALRVSDGGFRPFRVY